MPATGLDDRAPLAHRLGFGISVISGGAALPPRGWKNIMVRSPRQAADTAIGWVLVRTARGVIIAGRCSTSWRVIS